MQLRKVVNHGNVRWRVSTYIKGGRKQRFFVSKELAIQWMQELRSDSLCANFWSSRSSKEQRDIIVAFDLAKEKKLSLLNSVLATKTRFCPKSKLLADIIPLYLSTLKTRSLRDSSIKQIHLMLNQLASEYGNLQTNRITPSHLEQWFARRQWARSTIDGVIAKIGPFFTWCVREDYCETNPCEAVKRPRSEDKPPAIFRSHEAQKLLQIALEKDQPLIPYLAIGLFAGIRPAEIERLTHKDILEDYIEVSAAKAKTRQRRLVKISPNLKEWLAIKPLGVIRNKRKRLNRILELAQLGWQPDIMRHSFASYHLALHSSAEKTALELGHRDTKMLFAHYRELVTNETANQYWAIRP